MRLLLIDLDLCLKRLTGTLGDISSGSYPIGLVKELRPLLEQSYQNCLRAEKAVQKHYALDANLSVKVSGHKA